MDFTFGEIESLCPKIILFYPKLYPHGNFSSFQADGIFLFSKFFRRIDEKREVATPLIDQFL